MVCCILMHSSLPLTTKGLPLALTNSELGKNATGLPRLRRRSIRRAFPSRRSRAFGGWTMSGNPPSCWVIRNDASMSVIARATSMSCSAGLDKLESIS